MVGLECTKQMPFVMPNQYSQNNEEMLYQLHAMKVEWHICHKHTHIHVPV